MSQGVACSMIISGASRCTKTVYMEMFFKIPHLFLWGHSYYSSLEGLSNHSNLWELTLYKVINSLFIQSLCITLEHGRSIIRDVICQCMTLSIYCSPHHCMPFLDTKCSNPTLTPEMIPHLQ